MARPFKRKILEHGVWISVLKEKKRAPLIRCNSANRVSSSFFFSFSLHSVSRKKDAAKKDAKVEKLFRRLKWHVAFSFRFCATLEKKTSLSAAAKKIFFFAILPFLFWLHFLRGSWDVERSFLFIYVTAASYFYMHEKGSSMRGGKVEQRV